MESTTVQSLRGQLQSERRQLIEAVTANDDKFNALSDNHAALAMEILGEMELGRSDRP
jgi:uncharacterized protein YdcH (DUF465 family)